MIIVALAYIASALQIQTSFMSDPVGPQDLSAYLIGVVADPVRIGDDHAPGPDPTWPTGATTLLHLAIALAALIAYAYA